MVEGFKDYFISSFDEAAKMRRIAKACHNLNKEYCALIGDHSHANWEELDPGLKDSVINGVKFHLDNPDATPRDSHNEWLKFKRQEGWVYGEVKDVALKTHPNMVEYDELPTHEKVKDLLFKTVVDLLR